MATKRIIAIAILMPFSVLTIYALTQVGYWGIIDYNRYSPAGWQVLADLVIALTLVLTWLVPEARKDGRSPWLWAIATLFLGSIGPLLYLITAKPQSEQS